MLDVTPNDIAQLGDSDLRELVGRLKEQGVTISPPLSTGRMPPVRHLSDGA